MHSCPTCDAACYCNGDCEDHEDPAGAMECSHCDGECECDIFEDEQDPQ